MFDFLAAISTICFVSFAWAMRAHFLRDGRMPLGMRLLAFTSTVSFASFAVEFLLNANHPAPRVAAALFTVSLGLFWWAVRATRQRRLWLAHSLPRPDWLHVDGPYALIRHPFYASYVLFWLGTFMAGSELQAIPVACLVLWYRALAQAEETGFESSALVGAYRQYQSCTGMLVPRLSVRSLA